MRPHGILAAAALVVSIALVPVADAAVGSVFGARVQAVWPEVRELDVKVVNCLGPCILTWESLGASRLTLRCLDETGETNSSLFPSVPKLSHPCIVESTLEIEEATESVIVWRANACDAPECGPWPPRP